MTTRPSRERLQEMLSVDVSTGEMRWRKSAGRAKAGSLAGRISVHGYREVQVDKVLMPAHTVIWFFATGEWQPLIDHINGVRDDNRIENLRPASAADNARNRTNWRHRKLLGAFETSTGKYQAAITADGVRFNLGLYATEEEAHGAYVHARKMCLEVEKAARQRFLHAMQANLTVLEELQAGRLAA